MKSHGWEFLITGLTLLILGSACATTKPTDSGRRGLLDRGSASVFSTRSKSSRVAETLPLMKKSDQAAREQSRDPSENEPAAVPVLDRRSAHLRQVTQSWRWPLNRVAVTSPFGIRKGEFHEGIDLKASTGTPVYAVQEGKVLYAGSNLRGYGNLVVIKHPRSGLATIYAHNSRFRVHKGQVVRKGQLIALSGKSGHVTGPHLHFEVRDGVKAVDPLVLMGTVQRGRYLAIAPERDSDGLPSPAMGSKSRRSGGRYAQRD